MPSAVVHGVVPLLLLLALRRPGGLGLDVRKIWILWPLTFLPDLDYFVGLHRAALTNVFVLLPLGAVLVYAKREKRAELAEWIIVALVYLVSHMLMDMMTGGIVPLYPVSHYTVCYYADVIVHTADNSYEVLVGPCGHEGIPQVIEHYVWLSDTDSAILAFVLPAGLLMAGWQLRAYIQGRGRPEAAHERKSK